MKVIQIDRIPEPGPGRYNPRDIYFKYYGNNSSGYMRPKGNFSLNTKVLVMKMLVLELMKLEISLIYISLVIVLNLNLGMKKEMVIINLIVLILEIDIYNILLLENKL